MSPILASDTSRLQPFHCHSQPNPSSQWLEKSGILYVHIYLPAVGFLQLAGLPPAPRTPPHPSLPGRVNWRVGRDGLQRGMQDGETPPDPREENGIFLHLVRDEASLRSQRPFRAARETSLSLGSQVFTFSPRGGETVELSISVSQIQANALLQQFEAILALGFQG